jgi:uncharacterized membrane protein
MKPPPTFSFSDSKAIVATLIRLSGLAFAIFPFLPPILEKYHHPDLAYKFAEFWAPFCHRMPERSLSLFGEVMPICSRCLGLFSGAGLGLFMAWPFVGIRTLRITLSLAAVFLYVELTTQDLGWHPVFHPTRLLSGLLFAYPLGAAVGSLATGHGITQLFPASHEEDCVGTS